MKDCIFCKIVKGEIPSYKVYEDEQTFVFFDANPKNDYHTLVIPKEHYTNMFDAPEETAVAVMKTIKKILTLYSEKLGIKEAQILCNSGKNAQQEVGHLHYHIVPRFAGDGQNTVWPPARVELRDKFEEYLEKVRN